jgi:hypothetical protein
MVASRNLANTGLNEAVPGGDIRRAGENNCKAEA